MYPGQQPNRGYMDRPPPSIPVQRNHPRNAARYPPPMDSFDDDSFDSDSDDGFAGHHQTLPPRPSPSGNWRRPSQPITSQRQGGYQPQVPIPPRNDHEDEYMPIDPVTSQERGNGLMFPPHQPPRTPVSNYPQHTPQDFHNPPQNSFPGQRRPPTLPPQSPRRLFQGGFDRPQGGFDRPQAGFDRPQAGFERPQGGFDRPPIPTPDPFNQSPQDTYEPPTRQPPPIPTSTNRSPKSSFVTNGNRSPGFSPNSSLKDDLKEAISRNNSATSRSHTPFRDGSRDSTSSGEHSDPQPLPPPAEIPKMRNNKFMMFQQPPINKDTIKSKVIPPFRTETSPVSGGVVSTSNLRPSEMGQSSLRPSTMSQSNIKPPTTPKPEQPNRPPKPSSGFNRTSNQFPPVLPKMNEPKPTEKSNNIKDQPWFRDVDRASATVSVERDGREGCFIVRPGRDCRKTPYSLTVYSNHKTYNLQIALRSESTYAIGTEKPNEQTFNNVVELISFFMKSSLKLAEGEGNVTLRGPP
uniref:basic salivary proline-rich protein 4 isoform X2 n=1 Tax=Ciona intestinalis TaxID=7719 RepID=UPI0002B8DDF0|nr:basic salivary proline-rich protein 4 isoform X2 [Ciona intestinalis]|eukprot:XP_018668335.1 basic salivary proline-rich protein 4 isoform X2 [Ciona intestinalis]